MSRISDPLSTILLQIRQLTDRKNDTSNPTTTQSDPTRQSPSPLEMMRDTNEDRSINHSQTQTHAKSLGEKDLVVLERVCEREHE